MRENIEIIAHRGGAGPYPDNTSESFIYGIEQGASSIEMDIRYNYLTRNFFLAHSFIHHPKRRQNLLIKAVETIPRDVELVIEFKTVSFLTNIFVKNFVRFHDEHLKGRKVLVISFNPFVLMRLKRFAPDIARGIICGSHFWKSVHNYLLRMFVKAQYYVLNKRYLNTRNAIFARENGMKLFTYVINSERDWKKALRYEVDGIISDDPAKFTRLKSRLPQVK
ncbi:glycerophosphodiester phosphodiesterase [Patescibacteria group bacterium]|nr:glycerophosphodiester phosphodiesterase [Patescibacteria group bacterium]